MKDWSEVIQPIAMRHKVDPQIVQAMVQVESGGNPNATRFEPAYEYLFEVRPLASQLGLSISTVACTQQISWGLLQVMGAVAYERGFRGHLPELCQPSVGIEWGCAHLAWLRDRWGVTQEGLVSAYNQGSPKKTEGGMFQNQTYVDRVYAVLRTLRN